MVRVDTIPHPSVNDIGALFGECLDVPNIPLDGATYDIVVTLQNGVELSYAFVTDEDQSVRLMTVTFSGKNDHER